MAEENVNLNVNLGGSADEMRQIAEALNDSARSAAEYAKAVKEAADKQQKSAKFASDVKREIESRSTPQRPEDLAQLRAFKQLRAEYDRELQKKAYERIKPPKSQQEQVADAVQKKIQQDLFSSQVKSEYERRVPKVVKSEEERVTEAALERKKRMEYEKKVEEEFRRITPQKTREQEINEAAQRQLDASRKQKEIDRAVRKNQTWGERLGGGEGVGGMVRGIATGGLGSALMGAGAIGVALVALNEGAKKTTEAVNTMNNGLLNAGQKAEMVKEQLIPFYGTVKRLDEAVSGVTETMARHGREMEENARRNTLWSQQLSEGRGFYGNNIQPSRAVVTAYAAGVPEMRGANFDRSTAVGERDYREFGIMTAATDQRRDAEMKRRVAQAAVQNQATLTATTDKRNEAAQRKFLERRVDLHVAKVNYEREQSNKNKTAYSAALRDADTAQQQAAIRTAEAKAEIARQAELAKQAVQAEVEYQKANLAVMKAELDIMKQKEDRMASYAKNLGSMGIGDYERSKAMLGVVQEVGVENLPPGLVNEAAKIAPEFIEKQREKLGEKRAAEVGKQFGGIDDSVIQDFRQNSLKEIREKINKVELNVRLELQMQPAETAKALLAEVEPLLVKLNSAFKLEIKNLEDRIELDKLIKTRTDG